MQKDCSKNEASRILENRFSTKGFITYEKTCETDWRQLNFEEFELITYEGLTIKDCHFNN